MSRDGQERVRRAREAYERAQQEAGKLAMEASQAEAAKEQERQAQNEKRLADARDAVLAGIDAHGVPLGIVMVNSGEQVYTGQKHKTVYGKVKVYTPVMVPGWKLFHSDTGNVNNGIEQTIYLLADGSFARDYIVRQDSMHGDRSQYGRISLDELAALEQHVVDGIDRGLHRLAPGRPPRSSQEV